MSLAAADRIFWIRGLSYLLLLVVLGAFLPYVVLEGASYSGHQIFFLATLVTFAQLVVLFLPRRNDAILALFLSDALFFMVLVRVSGMSASPFLVLFPVLAALAPVLFRGLFSYILIGACLVMSATALGWGVGILGVSISILAVGALSTYLSRLLVSSEASLEKSETARRRLENLQKVILANIPSGLVSIDSDGTVIQVNSVGERILGIREGKFLRKPIDSLLPGIDPAVGVQGEDSLGNRRILEYLKDDGSMAKLGYSTAELKDPDGSDILGTLLVFQDLTKVISMENELRLNEKLAAVGKLAAGIAHEIRNPLAGISGSAQLLAGTKGLSEEDQHLLSIIRRESTRLDGLITEFLEFVRPPDIHLKAVKLYEVCQQVKDNLSVNPKWQGLESSLELLESGQELEAEAEVNKLTQIVMNLVLNAGQAGASKVQIEVLKGERNRVLIEVRDNGSGITEENQKRLFEPFFTTKDSGTGLGLAVSYKMLEAMGGRIDVISPAEDFCEKNGSIFRMTLNPAGGNTQ